MSRHSKNNTANSVFTYAERKKLENVYGTQKVRLGQDSQRRFEQCNLCLQTAKNPVICEKGHLFCRECITDNLLCQKKSLELKIVKKKLNFSKHSKKVKNQKKSKNF